MGAYSKQQMHLTAVLSVAEYILNHGPVVPTQQLVRVYKERKGTNETMSLRPATFLKTISRYLNVIQQMVALSFWKREEEMPKMRSIRWKKSRKIFGNR